MRQLHQATHQLALRRLEMQAPGEDATTPLERACEAATALFFACEAPNNNSRMSRAALNNAMVVASRHAEQATSNGGCINPPAQF